MEEQTPTLSLGDLIGDDYFFTPEGDAVFLDVDCNIESPKTGEVKEVESTTEPRQTKPEAMTHVDYNEKVHVIDPTTSCESFLTAATSDTKSSIIQTSKQNAVFPKRHVVDRYHGNNSQEEEGHKSFESIIQNCSQGSEFSKDRKRKHEEIPTSFSIRRSSCEPITSSGGGYDTPIETPPVTTSMTLAPDQVLSTPNTSSEKVTTGLTHPGKELNVSFQANPLGVFDPITGTYRSIGVKSLNVNIAVETVETTETMASQVQVPVPMSVPSTSTSLPDQSSTNHGLYHITELAPRDKLHPIQQPAIIMQVNEERRVRNREHARQSRLRKKILFESLEQSIKLLRDENKKIRNSIRQDVGDDQADVLFTKQNLSQVFATLTSKNLTISNPPAIKDDTSFMMMG